MRLFLMHIDNGPPRRDPREEVSIIVPGAEEKITFAVELGALERFLPALAQQSEGVEQVCGECGESLATMPPRWHGPR